MIFAGQEALPPESPKFVAFSIFTCGASENPVRLPPSLHRRGKHIHWTCARHSALPIPTHHRRDETVFPFSIPHWCLPSRLPMPRCGAHLRDGRVRPSRHQAREPLSPHSQVRVDLWHRNAIGAACLRIGRGHSERRTAPVEIHDHEDSPAKVKSNYFGSYLRHVRRS